MDFRVLYEPAVRQVILVISNELVAQNKGSRLISFVVYIYINYGFTIIKSMKNSFCHNCFLAKIQWIFHQIRDSDIFALSKIFSVPWHNCQSLEIFNMGKWAPLGCPKNPVTIHDI